MKLRTVVLLIFLLSGSSSVWVMAQDQLYIPLNKLTNIPVERQIYSQGSHVHTAIQPWIYQEVGGSRTNWADSVVPFSQNRQSRWLRAGVKAAADTHFISIQVDTANFSVWINPLVDVAAGRESPSGRTIYTNTRGIELGGHLGSKLSFYTSFLETQLRLPAHVNRFTRSRQIVPGQGKRKLFGSDAYDVSRAEAYVSFQPYKYVNVQLGQGKHFWGDGYRSLLLSDNSFNYPFVKLATQFWKIKYINLWTQFTTPTFTGGFGSGFPKKYGSFHYLSMNIGKKLQLGLFEGLIWQNKTVNGRPRGLEWAYFNPVIFYRPVEFSLASPDNVILGSNLKFTPFKKTALYGQVVIDDLNIGELQSRAGFLQQKYGFQLGIKSFDLAGIKGLNGQAEYNQVRPYTYAHKEPDQNYSHYLQPLAHPLGANFREAVFRWSYTKKRWFVMWHNVVARYGADSDSSHFGNNIFKSDTDVTDFLNSFDNTTGQGIETNLLFSQVEVNYLINPANRLMLGLSYGLRQLTNANGLDDSQSIVQVRLSTRLFNYYYDF